MLPTSATDDCDWREGGDGQYSHQFIIRFGRTLHQKVDFNCIF